MSQQFEELKSLPSGPSDSEKFLYQLNKLLYKHNTSKLDKELVSKIAQYSQKIMEKRRKNRQASSKVFPAKESAKQIASPSEIIEEYDESMERSTMLRRQQRVKPSYLKNLAATFTEKMIADNLLHFLEVKELLQVRLISREFSLACDKYFPFALQREADIIYREIEEESELNTKYMEYKIEGTS